jgi:hypothetical protein
LMIASLVAKQIIEQIMNRAPRILFDMLESLCCAM